MAACQLEKESQQIVLVHGKVENAPKISSWYFALHFYRYSKFHCWLTIWYTCYEIPVEPALRTFKSLQMNCF